MTGATVANNPAAFAIEPQRDMGSPSGEDGTWFVPCADEDAEHWAVFLTGVDADSLYVDDFASRAEAEAFTGERDPASFDLPAYEAERAALWADRTGEA